MKDLVAKLPRVDQQSRNHLISDSTIGAVLGILFEMVKYSADFTRFLKIFFSFFILPLCYSFVHLFFL